MRFTFSVLSCSPRSSLKEEEKLLQPIAYVCSVEVFSRTSSGDK